MKRLLAILFPPRQMPAPDRHCKTYTFAEAVQLYRNHDIARRLSRAHK